MVKSLWQELLGGLPLGRVLVKTSDIDEDIDASFDVILTDFRILTERGLS